MRHQTRDETPKRRRGDPDEHPHPDPGRDPGDGDPGLRRSQASATFWSGLLGWAVAHSERDYAMLTGPSHALGFGRVENYEPPTWPNEHGSKQFHFDLAVADLDSAAEAAVELGATLPVDQPGETWRVLLDPAGHPFCLTKAENWG